MRPGSYSFTDLSGLWSYKIELTETTLSLKYNTYKKKVNRSDIVGIGFLGQENREPLRKPDELGKGTLAIAVRKEDGTLMSILVATSTEYKYARAFFQHIVEDHPNAYIGTGKKREMMSELGLSYGKSFLLPAIVVIGIFVTLIVLWFTLGPRIGDWLAS